MRLLPWRVWPVIGTASVCLLSYQPTAAQIIPDGTLPENSRVTPQGNTSLIEGGTSTGSNLFHSFSEFSVPTGGTAYFNNAVDIQNIFTRVTGGNISNIDGLIKANGTANLFLLNPNGIIFGSNAQLNIGGSFLATTASSYRFADGIEFTTTNPQPAPILSVNVPIGLQLGANPGQIVNRSRVTATTPNGSILPVGLQVQPGRSLALVGGDIQLEGGFLTASAGLIELGSVRDSFVSLNPNLGYQNASNFADIQLSSGASINTSGIGGGSIQIRGGKVSLQQGSTLLGETLGNIDAGGIDIQANHLSLTDDSYISTTTRGQGAAGDITVNATQKVELTGSSVEKFQQIFVLGGLSGLLRPTQQLTGLLTGSEGEGTGGDITIDAPALLLQNGAAIGINVISSGKGGNLTIRTADFVQLVGSGIGSASLVGSTGGSGDVSIDTRRLIVQDASYIVSTTFGSGKGGNINVKASESVELLRTPDRSVLPTLISSGSLGTGNAGNISIDTQRLIARDGAGITSSSGTVVGTVLRLGGTGGSIAIRASEEVEVSGVSGVLANGRQINSFLTGATFTSFPGGNVSITTRRLTLKDGGQISTTTYDAGKAGDVTIDASERVEISGATGRFRSTVEASSGNIFNRGATGDGGSINLNTAESIVSDRGLITVSSLGFGKAGTLTVVADAMRLSNGAELNAATASGAGGNIILQTQSLQLRQQSQINTNAGNADGGNINLNTDTLAALENSDITANALSGRGGRITITAQGIFGTQFRDGITPQSDITATSDLGPQFGGIVEINTPDVEPSSGLVELPSNVVDISNLIASRCSGSIGNQFVVTGRGGLPPNPYEYLNIDAVWLDLRGFSSRSEARGSKNSSAQATNYSLPTTQIVEATRIAKSANGQVILTTSAPSGTPPSLTHASGGG